MGKTDIKWPPNSKSETTHFWAIIEESSARGIICSIGRSTDDKGVSLSIPPLIRGYSLVRLAITLEHHRHVPFLNKGIPILRAYVVQGGQLRQINRE
jgi:hypothetical protein